MVSCPFSKLVYAGALTSGGTRQLGSFRGDGIALPLLWFIYAI